MTDVSAAPVSTAPVEGQAAPAPNPDGPPKADMTGEEAKAWVEAQKAKKAPEKAKAPAKDPYLEDAPKEKSDQAKEAAAEAKRRLKISEEEELDEEEAIKIVRDRKQHQQAANRKLQEGLALRKQAEQAIEMLRDPDKVFELMQKLGHNPRELTEKYLASQLQEELLTPEQKALREKERRLAEYEERDRQLALAKEQEEANKLKQHYYEKFNKDFVEALQTVDVPNEKETIARMAVWMGRYANKNIEISAQDAALLVQNDLKREAAAILKKATPEQILAILGDENLAKLRKWDTSRVRSPEQFLKTPDTQPHPSQERRKKNDGPMTAKQWREFNRR